ncbi:MAG TPA: WecB/TagA/CpsF family glycosyltransferase [Candidatus Acidoferrales bacterium]|nr:WecB/TagA/CpsF family glycosyltransferase [Candidatus Acidoferrales bacterium]
MQEPSPAINLARAPIAILGVPFDNVNLAEVLAITAEMVASGQPHYATTVGVEFIAAAMDDVELRRILFDAHLVVAEDKTVVWASKILGKELPENVTIPKLIPQLLALAEQKNWRLFLLGGDDAVAARIRERHPRLQFTAYAPPPQPLLEMNHADLQRRLHAAKPDVLLVAFGSPKQEKWINMNYRDAQVPFVLGAGASFDFLAGETKPIKRAGKAFSKFIRAVLAQWWRLRAKKTAGAVAGPNVMPDPFGNLVIRAPVRLDAAAAQASLAEWMRAVENSHVMFDLADTVFADSTGVGALIRLRRRSRELGWQFFLITPRPAVEAALKQMKLEEFFTIQASVAGARIVMESAAGAAAVTSGVLEAELQIRWTGEVTALNAVELGAYTDSELSQVTPGMTVAIDLSRVTFMDSTGIGLMVRFKKILKRRNINLRFDNVAASVRNVVRQTQLEEFLLG